MNWRRFSIAVLGVFVVRSGLNALFYGMLMSDKMTALTEAHPGIFREVVPAYVTLDLVFAVLFTWLAVKTVAAFGGGLKGGVTLGLLIGVIGWLLPALYTYFSFTFYAPGDLVIECLFALVSSAISGALAVLLYRPAASSTAAPATA